MRIVFAVYVNSPRAVLLLNIKYNYVAIWDTEHYLVTQHHSS